MTKKYKALILEIDEVVEEEVLLIVEGATVKCFANYCPIKIEAGKQYVLEFDLVLPDHNCVVLSQAPNRQIEMTGCGFSCVISGYLDGATLRSFVDFMDLDLHYEYPHLNGKYVNVTVDRGDVSFE
jgi:hypothetical protein